MGPTRRVAFAPVAVAECPMTARPLIALVPLVLVPLTLAQGPATPAPDAPPAQAWPRFATAVSGSIYGLPDPGAPVLRELRAGEPLVVLAQKGALLEVE